MVHCLAYNCFNKNAALKKGISFFRLPKNRKLKSIWFQNLRLCNPPNTENVRDRVCSEHFTEDCLIPDMQATMGFKKTSKRLVEGAIPTLF